MLRHLTVLSAVVALGACTDESIVYRDRPPFNPPADQTNGFLGYFTASEKQTTCGNCHVGHQRDWKLTAHADAWAGLQNSGSAQPFCSGCHTVSQLGNMIAGQAGYNAVADSAYHDVQCESCHGPGLTHVTDPDIASNVPLAKVAAHEGDTLGTCGDCHSGEHHPFVEEWEQSRHGEANPEIARDLVGRASCVGCHEGRSVLKAWGVTANFVENSDPADSAHALGITCAVCHDPHGSPNSKQLRFPVATLDPAENLCMKCHMRRTAPYSGSSRGNSPHAPQGAVLLGDAGYINGAYVDTALLNLSSTATHASPTSNPRFCAGCHLFSFAIPDLPGQNATGHLFRPIPCYDGNGVPTDTITNCAFNAVARSWKPCATSGCHSTEAAAANLFAVSRLRMRDLSQTMWTDVDGDRTIDAYPTDDGILAKVKANTTDLNASAAPVTAADGAEFNVRLFGEDAAGAFMYDNGDKSHGVHNPFYAEALLRANINELTALYGAQPWFTPFSAEVQRLLNGPMGVSGSVPFPAPRVRTTSLR